MLEVEEQYISILNAYTITETKALHLRAQQNFKDIYGIDRKAGEEWLVTTEISPSSAHIVDINETRIGQRALKVLNKDQYCVVLDPFDTKKRVNRLGAKVLKTGPDEFFLQPGETLEDGCIKDIYILREDQALLVKAKETFPQTVTQEGKQVKITRNSGDRWMVKGPVRYFPSVAEEVLEVR